MERMPPSPIFPSECAGVAAEDFSLSYNSDDALSPKLACGFPLRLDAAHRSTSPAFGGGGKAPFFASPCVAGGGGSLT